MTETTEAARQLSSMRSEGAQRDWIHHHGIGELKRKLTGYIVRDIDPSASRGALFNHPLPNAAEALDAVAEVLAAIDRLDEIVYGTAEEQQARARTIPPMFELKTAAEAAGEGGRIRGHGSCAPTDHIKPHADNDVIRINAHSVRLRYCYDGTERTVRFDTKAEKGVKHWSVCPEVVDA